jgi:hypothetical protein
MMDRPSDRLPEPGDDGPEEDHIAEDGALWAFVEWIAAVSGSTEWTRMHQDEAERFLAWRTHHKGRTRWYA